ncbi:RNAse P Rpr2/Rpp21/SNM1 subunit domain-containing protein [Apodospora peruviana]|uniref:RNAse P Rpr2/Rpp21/SNM1 subunit domain-containing protein n=1 Tax=Apodospora peruviana TaxID=516989 RepID=A0AAE0ITH1_9PEZI|nr:RNAse P Rpr2/Rpp21/SNM1 subunit domain-containing protein [Apodospora peruviana]
MAKAKNGGGVQNRAIYSRVSFLQQAAILLSSSSSSTQPHSSTNAGNKSSGPVLEPESFPLQGLGRRLATDLRSVSLKTRIRLSPAVKQTICKFCDSILIDGETCTSTIENRSRGGTKPWADVLVRKCHACRREKRYPVSAPKQKRRTERADTGTLGVETAAAAHPQKGKDVG